MTAEKPDASPLPACGQQCDCHDLLNSGFHCSACDPFNLYDQTPPPDARVAAWTCAWESIQAAQKLRQPREDRGPRVAPEPLPDRYWAAVAEAAVYADLARADLPTGQQAFALVNAVETATEHAVETLTNILGVPPPDVEDHHCEYDAPNRCAWPGHRR